MAHLETDGHVTDVTHILASVVEKRDRWKEEDSIGVLAEIGGSFEGLLTDWDDGVPEEWSTFCYGKEVTGILRMDMPLGLVVKGTPGAKEAIAVLERRKVDLIVTKTWEEPELSFDSKVLETLLPDWYQSLIGIDEEAPPTEIPPFSMARLWWATV